MKLGTETVFNITFKIEEVFAIINALEEYINISAKYDMVLGKNDFGFLLALQVKELTIHQNLCEYVGNPSRSLALYEEIEKAYKDYKPKKNNNAPLHHRHKNKPMHTHKVRHHG